MYQNYKKENETDLTRVLSNLKDFIYRMSIKTGVYEYISPVCIDITGYSDEDFYKTPLFIKKILHPSWQNYFEHEYENLKKGNMPDYYEYQIIHKNGNVKWIKQHNTLIKDEKGIPSAIEGIVSDFTEFRRNESLLKIQRDLSETLSKKHTIEEILDLTLNHCLEVAGMDAGGIYLINEQNQHLQLIIHKGISENYYNQVKEYDSESENMKLVLKGEPVYTNYSLFSVKSGENDNFKAFAVIPVKSTRKEVIGCLNVASRTMSDVPVFVRDTLETIVRYAGIAIDRFQSESELEKSELSYRLLVENSPSVIWSMGRDCKMEFISQNIEKFLGYSMEELYSYEKSGWKSFVHPEDFESLQTDFKKLLNVQKTFERDIQVKKKNGDWICFHTKAVSSNKDGDSHIFGTGTDITNLKHIEHDLKKERDKAQNYFSIAGVIIVSIQKNGLVEAINNKGCEILGYREEEIIGKNWFDNFIPQRIRETVKSFFYQIIEGKLESLEYYENPVINKSGEERLIAWHNTVLKDADGKILATMSSGEDITEKKQHQQELFNAVIHAEEQERSRIAKDLHDGVSPVLSTLKLYFQSLILKKDQKFRETLIEKINEIINDAISSLREISNNLSPHILHNFGYIVAIQSFINRLKDTRNIAINFKSKFEDRFDEKIEITLYRITIELITNTIKHSNAGNILINFNKNNNFILKYEDDGEGFDVEKVMKERMGMGLFNMKNRIESLNGEININSKKGFGTKTTIVIPVNDKTV